MPWSKLWDFNKRTNEKNGDKSNELDLSRRKQERYE
jgi:hypothetical protein